MDATRDLLRDAEQAHVERFVLTSTLHTLAAGTAASPAGEASLWNLECVDSPYARSKREAEALVRQASQERLTTVVLCPGMVVGPRDPKPTSTRLLRVLARTWVAFLPQGGIPIVDAAVVARVHRRALTAGRPGERYAVVGPYLSYPELARLVAGITGNPRCIISLPDRLESPLKAVARVFERLGLRGEFSPTTVAGGFLRLHVSGIQANACFDLVHPPARETIRAALDDAYAR